MTVITSNSRPVRLVSACMLCSVLLLGSALSALSAPASAQEQAGSGSDLAPMMALPSESEPQYSIDLDSFMDADEESQPESTATAQAQAKPPARPGLRPAPKPVIYFSDIPEGLVFPPTSRVGLKPPHRFELSNHLNGFEHDALNASIRVQDRPAYRYDEISAEYIEGSSLGGDVLLTAQERLPGIKVPHVLLRGQQTTSGGDIEKYVLLLKDKATGIVTVDVMAEDIAAGRIREDDILDALSTTRVESWPPSLPRSERLFFVIPAGNFELQDDISNRSAIYADVVTPLPPDTPIPMYTVSPSPNDNAVRNIGAKAKTLFLQLPNLSGLRFVEERDIEIAGMQGMELIGTGLDIRSRRRLGIYQAFLTPGDGYYLLVGIAPFESAEEFNNVFRAMSESFSLMEPKDPTTPPEPSPSPTSTANDTPPPPPSGEDVAE